MILSEKISKRISETEKVLIAVSGGVDSLALLQAVHLQCRTEIVAVHVDHQLRKESADEGQTVLRFCEEREIKCILENVQINPDTSLQGTARIQRHAILRRCAAREGISYILTAHHLDDYAETMLMNLGRGGGIQSLSFGPEKKHPPFVYLRPFFDISRARIEAFARSQKLEWCEDPSNKTEAYLRNRIRHNLADLREHYGDGLKQSARRILDAKELVNLSINSLWKINYVSSGPYHISFRRLDHAEIPQVREFLRHLATSFFGVTLSETNVEQCVALIRSSNTKTLSLHGIQVEQSDLITFRKSFGRGNQWWTDLNKDLVLEITDLQTNYQWFEWELTILPASPISYRLKAGKKVEFRNWTRGMTRDGKSLSKVVKTHTKNLRWRIPCLFIENEVHWILGDTRVQPRLGINLLKSNGTLVEI